MPPASTIGLRDDEIRVGRNVRISFQRTLRIPDDGRDWPLPPGLGRFPIRRIDDYADRVPDAWREEGGFFVPMYQREALWIAFGGAWWRPNAVKVGVGAVDAVAGLPWDLTLRAAPQDHVVVPEQPWLDGINAGPGVIRQFVAAPLGRGLTVEAQVAGTEDGGMRLVVFEPKPGRFPDRPPARSLDPDVVACPPARHVCEGAAAYELGLAAGGRMVQKIYPDEHGEDTWDATQAAELRVRIVTSAQWTAITGEAPPPTPVSAETYLHWGLPWFALYDEHRGDVAAPDALASVRSLDALEATAPPVSNVVGLPCP